MDANVRLVKRLWPGEREDVGNLVTRRARHGMEQFDPFLFINHHGPQTYPPHNEGLPFGPHPHRGFETVTFIVEGSLTHRDTEGYESTIESGGVQWMTAGRGVEHSETSPPQFLEQGGPLEILQLWVNLPARLKMSEPRYTGLQRSQIPAIAAGEGATLHLIAGEWEGQHGPVETLTGIHMATLALAENGRASLHAPEGRTVLLYIVRGEVRIGEQVAGAFDLAEMSDRGDRVDLAASRESLVIFGHGAPLREPIVSYGPFVMNTQGEIRQAMLDYQAGRFGGKVRI